MNDKMRTVAATVAATVAGTGIVIGGSIVSYTIGYFLVGRVTAALADKAVKKILGTENDETNED